MSRFTDDLVSMRAHSAEMPPQLVLSLLMELDRAYSPRGDQELAIAEWLANNQPGVSLAQDLQDEGFGHLLTPRMTA